MKHLMSSGDNRTLGSFKEKAVPMCYRVWFMDGTALLVDARDRDEAKQLALEKAFPGSKVRNMELL